MSVKMPKKRNFIIGPVLSKYGCQGDVMYVYLFLLLVPLISPQQGGSKQC